ncbi:MAG: Holliday junction resolvase RecU [Bacteroidales bacterium]|nr:Holliday junction resolvase RecU [Bacteroidales bacterium]
MIRHANRGRLLEEIVELTNQAYKSRNIAYINKQPTPLKVVGGKEIYHSKAGLDFAGVVQGGRHIAFDCKTTRNSTSFPLGNVKEHQIEQIRTIHLMGGLSFLLVYWEKIDKMFVVPAQMVLCFWDNALTGGKKSIPYSEFAKTLSPVGSTKGIILDYLSKLISN